MDTNLGRRPSGGSADSPFIDEEPTSFGPGGRPEAPDLPTTYSEKNPLVSEPMDPLTPVEFELAFAARVGKAA